jgi:hypothetical protein
LEFLSQIAPDQSFRFEINGRVLLNFGSVFFWSL